MGSLCSLLLALSLLGCGKTRGPKEIKQSQAQYGLANDAFQKGRFREALAHVQQAIELDAENAEAQYLGGMVMLVFCANDSASPDCRWDEAEAYLRQTLALEPRMRDARNALGVVLVHRKQPQAAIRVLEPLTKDILYRSPEKAWGNLGWAYLEAGRPDDAVQALKRAVAAQPLFCVGHYRLGLAFEKKGEYAAARRSLTRALGIEEGGCSRLQEAFLARARVLTKLGKLAETRTDLERCQAVAAASPVGKQCARRLGSLH